ncbi:MAG: hypothetical protein QNJ65_02560 [Xenococcaceae cyanobacterium MO_234.B1]|nr:hypothetical protein [Xenococcaceae cyanobacterium MO_234.B1]
MLIVWSFLSQVLDPDHSCQNAVSRIISYLASEGLETPSENTSAYCQARKKLPEKLFKKLLEITAKNNEKKVSKKHLWHGRCVKSIDGSTVSMPDTLKNQETYPQHSSQKKGCGPGGGILSYLCDSKLSCGDISPLPAFCQNWGII